VKQKFFSCMRWCIQLNKNSILLFSNFISWKVAGYFMYRDYLLFNVFPYCIMKWSIKFYVNTYMLIIWNWMMVSLKGSGLNPCLCCIWCYIIFYRMQNLPFTITSLPLLKAVWLSENQSQPMPHFSTDYVFNEPVLTCYLLPQLAADQNPRKMTI
jgi:hypothetical protein